MIIVIVLYFQPNLYPFPISDFHLLGTASSPNKDILWCGPIVIELSPDRVTDIRSGWNPMANTQLRSRGERVPNHSCFCNIEFKCGNITIIQPYCIAGGCSPPSHPPPAEIKSNRASVYLCLDNWPSRRFASPPMPTNDTLGAAVTQALYTTSSPYPFTAIQCKGQ